MSRKDSKLLSIMASPKVTRFHKINLTSASSIMQSNASTVNSTLLTKASMITEDSSTVFLNQAQKRIENVIYYYLNLYNLLVKNMH